MTTERRPNILFVLADDMGWGDVSYHGSDVRTPNIDRLVQKGVELDQHYVCPMCTPTRACLMTGRHPGRFGRHATTPSNPPVLPDGYETLAASLRNCGYDTGLFGKWHLGSRPEWGPNHFGFNTAYGSLAGGVDPYSHRYKVGEYSITWHRNGELIEERGHVTDLIAAQVVEWIEAREGPWLCYVPFTAVHTPVKAPQSWIDTYEDRQYDLDPNRDRSFKVYGAYASQMDHAIGQFIETLARRGILDDTMVVFTSDNGAIPADPLHDTDKYPGRFEEMPRLGSNLPLRGQKAQMYEGGIRTPSVVCWPGTLKPRKVTHPLHIVDWMPTLTKLIGCEPQTDPRWDGVDVWPVLTGQTERLPERDIHWNFAGRKFGVRSGDWKLITDESMAPENSELLNIETDPYEKRDRVAERPGLVEELLEKVAEDRKLDGVSKRDGVE